MVTTLHYWMLGERSCSSITPYFVQNPSVDAAEERKRQRTDGGVSQLEGVVGGGDT